MAFSVPSQEVRFRASRPAPKCCWKSAAISLFPSPVLPERWMLKSVSPSAARYAPEKRGTITPSGATSQSASDARAA